MPVERSIRREKDSVFEKTLKNGFRLIVYEKPYAEIVTSHLLIKNGSDPAFVRQLVLDHWAPDGTKNFPDFTSILNSIESRGGKFEIETSDNDVQYVINLPKKYGLFSLDILYEIVSSPVFRSRDLKREKGIVKQEHHENIDNPEEYLTSLLYELVWENNDNFGKTHLTGKTSWIRSASKDGLLPKGKKEELRKPNSMTLIIAGPVKGEKVLVPVQKSFGSLPPFSGEQLSLPTPEPDVRNGRVLIENKDLEQVYISLAFLVSESDMKNYYRELDLLAKIFDKAVGERLVHNLGIAHRTDSEAAQAWTISKMGAIIIQTAVDRKNLDLALKNLIFLTKNPDLSKKNLILESEALKGKYELYFENMEKITERVAEEADTLGKPNTKDQALRQISKLKNKRRMKRLHQNVVTNETVRLVILGPVSERRKKTIERKLRFGR